MELSWHSSKVMDDLYISELTVIKTELLLWLDSRAQIVRRATAVHRVK